MPARHGQGAQVHAAVARSASCCAQAASCRDGRPVERTRAPRGTRHATRICPGSAYPGHTQGPKAASSCWCRSALHKQRQYCCFPQPCPASFIGRGCCTLAQHLHRHRQPFAAVTSTPLECWRSLSMPATPPATRYVHGLRQLTFHWLLPQRDMAILVHTRSASSMQCRVTSEHPWNTAERLCAMARVVCAQPGHAASTSCNILERWRPGVQVAAPVRECYVLRPPLLVHIHACGRGAHEMCMLQVSLWPQRCEPRWHPAMQLQRDQPPPAPRQMPHRMDVICSCGMLTCRFAWCAYLRCQR